MSLIPEIDAFLGCPTPDAWIEAALADQETLLIDHKNCEFKAASTALSPTSLTATTTPTPTYHTTPSHPSHSQ